MWGCFNGRDDLRFKDKVAVVTGGASGIGLAATRGLLAEGAKVMIADADVERGEHEAGELGALCDFVRVDVRRPESCADMVARVLERFGRLDIAINNAGIPAPPPPSFETLPVEDWDNVISANLSGVFYAMRAEAKAMRAGGGGSIVNTGSVASVVANVGMPAYVAAKHGVAGLTKAAALDLLDAGIRVNAVGPGIIETPMTRDALRDPEIAAGYLAMTPAARPGTADEVARTILFLASDDASFTTGTLAMVDGGLTLR
ncbi:MAG: short-chain dehydrogenase [Novosphingobium lindaniclasticum]|jgi:NAD(P)-dependent dehydrogenase (short-subunit alcohol dehydrogenase family)|uniref:SDR family NAD(P)-dependent oxidoreductase n=1 Tax=Novosphingobium lindaniclasticum TaxID=1329895 RepID=UPI00240A76FD|nr:SDR family NAD(P)-dependent oxidoreductase [Novosphingobium lindaniclasticum]MDF2638474.1 short-chain dehydrogenase [Novosphingobium lindaniclasticum]